MSPPTDRVRIFRSFKASARRPGLMPPTIPLASMPPSDTLKAGLKKWEAEMDASDRAFLVR